MSDFSIGLFSDDFQVIAGGRLQIAEATKTVRDRILTRIQTELGEWYLNNAVGVPWYSSGSQVGILGSKMQADEISAILRRQILDVDGVVSIETFAMDFDATQRKLNVSVDVKVLADGTKKLIKIDI